MWSIAGCNLWPCNLFSFTFSDHKNISQVKHFIPALQSIFHFIFQAAKTKYLIYCRMQFLAPQFIFHLFFQVTNTSTNFLLVLQSIFHLFFEAAKTKICDFSQDAICSPTVFFYPFFSGSKYIHQFYTSPAIHF